MKLIHSLFSLSLLLALSGLFCTTACQDDAEPTQRAGLISTDSLIHAAKVYDGKAFEHVVSTTAAGLRVSEPRRVVPMLPRQLHVEMEGKTLFRRHNLPSVSAYSFQVLAVGDTIYRQKESDAQFNADLDALFHQSIGIAPRLFGVKELFGARDRQQRKDTRPGQLLLSLVARRENIHGLPLKRGRFPRALRSSARRYVQRKRDWLLNTRPSLLCTYLPSACWCGTSRPTVAALSSASH